MLKRRQLTLNYISQLLSDMSIESDTQAHTHMCIFKTGTIFPLSARDSKPCYVVSSRTCAQLAKFSSNRCNERAVKAETKHSGSTRDAHTLHLEIKEIQHAELNRIASQYKTTICVEYIDRELRLCCIHSSKVCFQWAGHKFVRSI